MRLLGRTALVLAVWLPAVRAGAELIVVDTDWTWRFSLDKGAPGRLAVRYNLSLTRTSFLIRPIPLLVPDPGTLFALYASSPYSPTNYLTAFATDEEGKLTRIAIDNHPSRHLGDLPEHLVRLAYIDPHRFEPTFSLNDYFHIVMQTMPYEHSEIRFEARLATNQGQRVVESVQAYSPEYVPLGRGRKQRLQGEPRRLLWEFRVTGWTNIENKLYASGFTYTGYPGVFGRIEQDNLEPLVRCTGRLVGIRREGLELLKDMLARRLEVVDFRPSAKLEGYPVVYQVTNGFWLEEGSPELAALVSAKKRELALEPRLVTKVAPQSKRYVAAFVVLLFAPLVLLAFRSLAARRRQRLTPRQ